MKISVITVCFNAAETIGDALRSVEEQIHPDIEHLVIDGGSTDGTQEIVEEHARPWRYMVSESDEGLYDAMNKGVGMASGDLIGNLNADDLFQDEHVLQEVDERFSKADVDGVYGDLVYVDKEDTGRVKRRWKAGPFRPERFRKGWMPPHPTFYVHRSLFDRYGAYRTELLSSADYELLLRFAYKQKARLAYLDRTMVRMRTGGKSNVSLKNRIRANMEDRKAWGMNGLRPPFYTLWMKPVSKLFQFFQR